MDHRRLLPVPDRAGGLFAGEGKKMNEADLIKAIMVRWPMTVRQPRYVTAVQVHNGAGFGYSRKLDAIVFDTWPSKGLRLHGLEIKTSRGDLRRELQDTRKFAEFEPHLDLFSIVAPKGIVDLKILPPKWGLYIPDGEGLRARRKPLSLHSDKRAEMSRSIAAAFVRALVDRSLSREAQDAEYQRGFEIGKKEGERISLEAKRHVDELERAISEFQEASGVQILTWNANKIGEAVKTIMDGGIMKRIRFAPDIRDIGMRLIALADELDYLKDKFSEP